MEKQGGYLTTEWLPWLQTNWRDSSYERIALVLKTNWIRKYSLFTTCAYVVAEEAGNFL